jgi:hypothetical protein
MCGCLGSQRHLLLKAGALLWTGTLDTTRLR